MAHAVTTYFMTNPRGLPVNELPMEFAELDAILELILNALTIRARRTSIVRLTTPGSHLREVRATLTLLRRRLATGCASLAYLRVRRVAPFC